MQNTSRPMSVGVCLASGLRERAENLNVIGFRRLKWHRLWSTSFPPTIKVVDQCVEVGTICSHCRPTGVVVVCGSPRDQRPPPIQHPPPIRRADRRNAPKGAQRARRLADARGESNTSRGKHAHASDSSTASDSTIDTASDIDSGSDMAMSAEGANARRCTRREANARAEICTHRHKHEFIGDGARFD